MNIAVIPARGGSKRILKKNIRTFCGRPMIQYSIDAALATKQFDRVIVSTDSDEIAELSLSLGAEVPFRRPANLADDLTPTIPVIRHAVEWIVENGVSVEYACCLYATAPFVMPDDLVRGLDLLQSNPLLRFSIPVTTFPFPIFRGLTVDDGQIKMIWPAYEQTRSQDLPEAWHDAGQFYWGTADAWQSESGLYSAMSAAIPIPRARVQDIDSEEDWQKAEAMYTMLCNAEN